VGRRSSESEFASSISDNAGNLLNDGTAAFTYDALGRTTARGTATYASNGDSTLVAQATGGVTTRSIQQLAG
jgi:hypothetical protein